VLDAVNFSERAFTEESLNLVCASDDLTFME
jgi:hypothetical protein